MSAVLLVEDDRMCAARCGRASATGTSTSPRRGAARRRSRWSRTSPPDLVVLDLTLPGIDGLETLRHLRTFTDVPVVVLTVRDSLRDKISAFESGADDYVLKPFAPEELLHGRGRTSAGRVGSASPRSSAPATSRSTWPRAS